MECESPLAVVQAWQAAVNCRDTDSLVELSSAGIEIAGPRGAGRGHALLREWVDRAGLTLETLQAFVRGNVVVVAQRGTWRSVETGEELGAQDLASCFRVEGGRVVRFARYDTLEAALQDAGLDRADERPHEG
ncbi:MAG TPA: nuclear transport factor 2 family protein [Armatimonadota bacterium]|nr:nuclear transport factor 2 family protein [Armatimonadota bacterium]